MVGQIHPIHDHSSRTPLGIPGGCNGMLTSESTDGEIYRQIHDMYRSIPLGFTAGDHAHSGTIGAMMLPFGCYRSQPILNILADNFFSKNGQVKFWPDNENFGSV